MSRPKTIKLEPNNEDTGMVKVRLLATYGNGASVEGAPASAMDKNDDLEQMMPVLQALSVQRSATDQMNASEQSNSPPHRADDTCDRDTTSNRKIISKSIKM